MVTARSINVERCSRGPARGSRSQSRCLLVRISMTLRKRQILECWRQDALELQAAADEAMSGSEESMLKRVLDAIRTLERQTDAQRQAGRVVCRDGKEIGYIGCLWRHLPNQSHRSRALRMPVRCAARGSDLHEPGLRLAIVQVWGDKGFRWI